MTALLNRKVKDLRGRRFGMLLVKDEAPESRPNQPRNPKAGAQAVWLCLCDCGAEKKISASTLRALRAPCCGSDSCRIALMNLAGRPLPMQLRLHQPPIGKVFGRLTVVGDGDHRNNKRRWAFRCLCGVEKEIQAAKVTRGGIQSCGCLMIERVKKSNTKYADPLQKWRNMMLCGYKRHATDRGLEFTLPKDDFIALTKEPCAYCGRLNANVDSKRYDGKFPHNGVDRIDSFKGYVRGNVTACCKTCNMMKQRLTVSEFIAHVKLVIAHAEATSLV